MKRTAVRVVPAIALLALGVATFVPRIQGQNTGQPSTKNGEWPMYTADLSGSKYSPLDQIGASNFSKLEVAWRFKTDNLGPRPDFNLQASPLMVNGRLYFTAGSRRAAVSVDAASGELLWVHRLEEGARADNASRRLSGRAKLFLSSNPAAAAIVIAPEDSASGVRNSPVISRARKVAR